MNSPEVHHRQAPDVKSRSYGLPDALTALFPRTVVVNGKIQQQESLVNTESLLRAFAAAKVNFRLAATVVRDWTLLAVCVVYISATLLAILYVHVLRTVAFLIVSTVVALYGLAMFIIETVPDALADFAIAFVAELFCPTSDDDSTWIVDDDSAPSWCVGGMKSFSCASFSDFCPCRDPEEEMLEDFDSDDMFLDAQYGAHFHSDASGSVFSRRLSI